jgi:hypothetical protein
MLPTVDLDDARQLGPNQPSELDCGPSPHVGTRTFHVEPPVASCARMNLNTPTSTAPQANDAAREWLNAH